MRIKKTNFYILLSAVPFQVFSQSTELNQVLVEDYYVEQTLKDMPLRTEVISSKELERMHAKTLADALKYTSGIDIKPIGSNSENGSGVAIQGLDPSQVLIMVDGNPVAPNSGEMVDTVDITQILMGDVEKIEIIKGGASALYGANAMGGVVNIITKNPDKPLSLSADISAGGWGEKGNEEPIAKDHAILSASSKIGKVSAQLIANFQNQKGYDTDPDEIGTDGWHGYKNNYSAKLHYDFDDDHRLTIAPTFYRAKTATHKQSQDIYKTMKQNRVSRERNTWDASFRGQMDELSYKFHLMDQVYDELTEGVVTRLDQKSKNKNYDVKLVQEFSDSHLSSFTIKYQEEFLSQYNLAKQKFDVDQKSKQSTDIAFNHSWFINDNLEFMPAVRFNDDEFYGSHTSPMLSLAYANSNWIDGVVNIRTSVSDGYKTPTLKQMYWEFDHGSLWLFGNPELVPENSTSTQLSFEFLTNDNSRYEINLFNNDIENLIETSSDPDKAKAKGIATAMVYSNVNNARTRGVDLAYKKTFQHSAFTTSYTYLDAINLDTGKELPEKSKHQFTLGMDFFNWQDISVGIKYRFNSRQYTDFTNSEYVGDYDTLDLKFNQKLNKNTAWYFGIDNLLDNIPEQYSTAGGHDKSGNEVFPKSPRYIYLGLRLKH